MEQFYECNTLFDNRIYKTYFVHCKIQLRHVSLEIDMIFTYYINSARSVEPKVRLLFIAAEGCYELLLFLHYVFVRKPIQWKPAVIHSFYG